jgi:hypothetical protein
MWFYDSSFKTITYSDKHIYALIIQVTPYVFIAFIFHSLLDQKFFETYGTNF